jgi:hypothetical protein
LVTDVLRTTNDNPSAIHDDRGVVVINGTALQQPLYVGEFTIVGDAIDFQYIDDPDAGMISDSYEEALRRYAA